MFVMCMYICVHGHSVVAVDRPIYFMCHNASKAAEPLNNKVLTTLKKRAAISHSAALVCRKTAVLFVWKSLTLVKATVGFLSKCCVLVCVANRFERQNECRASWWKAEL